jgi:myb proto-oncogene protein
MNYDWKAISSAFPSRSAAEVEQRWRQRIDPTTKKSSWTKEEDQVLVLMHQKFGGKWKLISNYLPGRLPSSIKNRFYGKIYKQQSKELLASIQEPRLLQDEDDELYIESLLDLSDTESMISINNHLSSQYNCHLVAE